MRIFIKNTETVSFNGINYTGGQYVDFPDAVAKEAIKSGAAVEDKPKYREKKDADKAEKRVD